MMKKFSKASGDVSLEFKSLIEKEKYLIDGVIAIKQKVVSDGLLRAHCTLCENDLSSEIFFLHQGLDFCQCSNCGQLQMKYVLSEAAQDDLDNHLNYTQIYPQLDEGAYVRRRDAVYKPKLDFLLEVLRNNNIAYDGKRWLEIGCGAGYFLSALEQAGQADIIGYDRDAKLLDTNKRMLRKAEVLVSTKTVSDLIAENDFDILTSVFVLEHVEKLSSVCDALKTKNKGTVFYFSVPVFGMATVLESALADHAGRNLDGLIHQQAFSENSIAYFLDRAGYEMIGNWVFGQDAMDWVRMLMVRIGNYPDGLFDAVSTKLTAVLDDIQAVIDQHEFADSRHIVAVRK